MNRLFLGCSFVALLAGCSVNMSAKPAIQGSGTSKTETRTIEEFKSLRLAVNSDVTVTCGQDASLSITSDDNLLPLIKTVVKDGVLLIESDNTLVSTAPTTIKISVQALDKLSIEGGGDIHVEGMKTTDAKLSIAGAGAISGDLTAESVDVGVAGSGELELTGTAGKVDISIAGSGDAKLYGLVADDVKISIGGSGDAQVFANKSLEVSIAGSGNVMYDGAVQSPKTSIAGSGDVSHR